jgi:formamidopyrimidine-DNA glycosylase
VPELPEVETTRRGIEPYVAGQKIREVVIRRHDLRQPVSPTLITAECQRVTAIDRRSKYLIFTLGDASSLLVHLGMSGSLRLDNPDEPFKKHDHIALTFANGKQLRFHDPRRFGIFLHLPAGDPMEHPLLQSLGPEPLSDDFNVKALAAACAKRTSAIKLVVMDAKVVVGVGNIYASEALFRAGILPQTPASKISKPRLARLVEAIHAVLTDSIEAGGTTLRDFLHSDGKPGYFAQRLNVYNRQGKPCRKCGTAICHEVLGQRATYWCPKCQR